MALLGAEPAFEFLVQFGLLFLGFLSQELYLDTFLISILNINPFYGYSGL